MAADFHSYNSSETAGFQGLFQSLGECDGNSVSLNITKSAVFTQIHNFKINFLWIIASLVNFQSSEKSVFRQSFSVFSLIS